MRAGGSASPTCAALRGKPSLLHAVPANHQPADVCAPRAALSDRRPFCLHGALSVRTAAVDRLRHRAVAVVGPQGDEPDRDGAVHAARSPERCVCVRACVRACVRVWRTCCWVRCRRSSSTRRQIQTTALRGETHCAFRAGLLVLFSLLVFVPRFARAQDWSTRRRMRNSPSPRSSLPRRGTRALSSPFLLFADWSS